jgi:hypothetical protein
MTDNAHHPAMLLLPAEAARRLRITPNQLFAFVRDGELHYINMGRGQKRPRYRFSEGDINGLIEKRKELEAPCPSTNRKNRHLTGGTTSKSVVNGFMARRAAQIAAKPKK